MKVIFRTLDSQVSSRTPFGLRRLLSHLLCWLTAAHGHEHFLLAARSLAPLCLFGRILGADALLQRFHQIHNVVTARSRPMAFWLTMCLARSSMSFVTLTSWSALFESHPRSSYTPRELISLGPRMANDFRLVTTG